MLEQIQRDIERNRDAAARLVPSLLQRDEDARHDMDRLNLLMFDLLEDEALLTGTPLAPYRIGH